MAAPPGGVGILSTNNALEINNSGTIGGEAGAIIGGTGADVINNSGALVGNVNLGGAEDFYYRAGDGVVTGILDLGAGNDFAQLGNSGGSVFADTGDDTIRGAPDQMK